VCDTNHFHFQSFLIILSACNVVPFEVKATSRIEYQLALFLEANGIFHPHIDDLLIGDHVSSENAASDREA